MLTVASFRPRSRTTNSRGLSRNKPAPIQHQINNQGCLCDLCQKLIFQKKQTLDSFLFFIQTDPLPKQKNSNQIVRNLPPDLQQQKLDEEEKPVLLSPSASNYISFILHHHQSSAKQARKIRFAIPELCLFEHATPICLITKKKVSTQVFFITILDRQESHHLRVLRNRQKLHPYGITFFFCQGFLFHNRTSNEESYKYTDSDVLKSQHVAIARFNNNPGQLVTPSMINNLFKSKLKAERNNLRYFQTLVGSKAYLQQTVKIQVSKFIGSDLYKRAKNQVAIIFGQVSPRQYEYVTEQEEAIFQQSLKLKDAKQYLDYLSLKFILYRCYRLGKNERQENALWEKCIFKYVKSVNASYPTPCFYLVDLFIKKTADRRTVWGGLMVNARNAEEMLHKRVEAALQIPADLQSRYSAIQKTGNTLKLEALMNDIYERDKKILFEGRLERIQMRENERKGLLDQSLPEIKTAREYSRAQVPTLKLKHRYGDSMPKVRTNQSMNSDNRTRLNHTHV